MGVVRLGPSEVEVIDPGTPEEQARAWEKVLEVARALGRLAAKQNYDRAVAEARARHAPQPEGPADE
jgi:hypothetical protein